MNHTKHDTHMLRQAFATAEAEGRAAEMFCSFTCSFSDSAGARHAACLAVNGVYCGLLAETVLKGLPCRVRALLRRNPA